jgi:2-dehydropantoate 2-reductase
VAFIYSKIAEPGVIDHYKKGAVAVGEFMGHESERLLRIRDLFTAAGIPCQLSRDIRRSKWEKMCWNCVFNPITVLINDQVAKALDHPDMMQVIRQIVGEIMAVSAAMKVPLPSDMADRVVKWTQEIRDIHTSMYDDWKAGRPTEIDYLNGFIVRQGREFGIPTPVNQSLTALITVITAKDRSGPDIVRIDGDVVQPLSLDRRTLGQLPEEHRVEDVGSLASGMTGRAVTMKGLLEVPALGIQADHVTIHSQDGRYAATLTLEQARQHGLLLFEIEGKPIPASKGGPFRFIAPGLGDLCAHVKGVGRIEVRAGMGNDSRPSPERRKHC